MPKITFIGAGSTVFAKDILVDILSYPELADSAITLFDIDEERLRTSKIVAHKVARALDARPAITTTTDRRAALDGADYAFSMFQVATSFPFGAAFAEGRYDVRLVRISSGEMRVISEGRFGSSRARIGADVRNTALTDPNSGINPRDPFRQAIFANGNLRFNGTPRRIRGSLFTNNDFILNGQYSNLESLIYARNSAAIPIAHRGDWAEQHVPRLTDPDFAAFIESARQRGVLREFNGNTTFPRDILSPAPSPPP